MTVTNSEDPASLALGAIAWILSDDDRAQRFLALTGLSPDDLRNRLTDASLQAAALNFLEMHEPDLLACADAMGCSPETIVFAARDLPA